VGWGICPTWSMFTEIWLQGISWSTLILFAKYRTLVFQELWKMTPMRPTLPRCVMSQVIPVICWYVKDVLGCVGMPQKCLLMFCQSWSFKFLSRAKGLKFTLHRAGRLLYVGLLLNVSGSASSHPQVMYGAMESLCGKFFHTERSHTGIWVTTIFLKCWKMVTDCLPRR